MLNLTSGILFFTVGTVCMTRMFLGPLGFILWILPLVQVRSVFLLKRVLRAVFFQVMGRAGGFIGTVLFLLFSWRFIETVLYFKCYFQGSGDLNIVFNVKKNFLFFFGSQGGLKGTQIEFFNLDIQTVPCSPFSQSPLNSQEFFVSSQEQTPPPSPSNHPPPFQLNHLPFSPPFVTSRFPPAVPPPTRLIRQTSAQGYFGNHGSILIFKIILVLLLFQIKTNCVGWKPSE